MAGKLTDEQRRAADLAARHNWEAHYENRKADNVYKVRVRAVFPDARAQQNPTSGGWFILIKQIPRLYRGPGAHTEAEAWRDAWDILDERA